jgi:hypothetical protein
MALFSLELSLAGMRRNDVTNLAEYNESDYARQVLQLGDGQTEDTVDQRLRTEAEKLGITVSRPVTPDQNAHVSLSGSALTVMSHHARTGSTGSQDSASTGITSRSSNEHLDTDMPSHLRKRTSSRRSLSFSEYDNFLVQAITLEATKSGFLTSPPPSEPAVSLFSVSTRRSISSIKSGIKNKFRLRKSARKSEETLVK